MIFLKEAEADMDVIEEYLSSYYASTVRNFFDALKDDICFSLVLGVRNVMGYQVSD